MSDEKKTILIVDDEPDARAFVETAVSEIGDFNILTASNAEDALETMQTTRPDLVILDVMMPGRSGFDTFKEMRRREPTVQTPVIMLTGVSEQTGIAFSGEDMGEYFGASPAAFLDKPVEPKKLQETVLKNLGG